MGSFFESIISGRDPRGHHGGLLGNIFRGAAIADGLERQVRVTGRGLDDMVNGRWHLGGPPSWTRAGQEDRNRRYREEPVRDRRNVGVRPGQSNAGVDQRNEASVGRGTGTSTQPPRTLAPADGTIDNTGDGDTLNIGRSGIIGVAALTRTESSQPGYEARDAFRNSLSPTQRAALNAMNEAKDSRTNITADQLHQLEQRYEGMLSPVQLRMRNQADIERAADSSMQPLPVVDSSSPGGPVQTQPPAAPTTSVPPAPFDMTRLASGTPMTVKLMNQIELAIDTGQIQRQVVGQGQDAREVFLQDGKIIGGLDHNARDQTIAFLGRDKLDAELGPTGKSVAGIEAATRVAGEMTSFPGTGTAAPSANRPLNLNSTYTL